MELFVYSPERVFFTIAGLHTIEGYASGTFINISKLSPVFTARESSDGKVSRSMYNSGAYNVSLTLHQASPSNQVLAYISKLDELTQSGTFPILIKNGSGGDIFTSTEAWINSIPDVSYSDSGETREWNFTATGVSQIIGDGEETDTVQDVLNVGLGYLPKFV